MTNEIPIPDGGTAAEVDAEQETEEVQEQAGYVGREMRRVEDDRLVTGQGGYIDDLEPVRNIHHLAILRSPHAHARIERIETAEAEALSGVKTVLTGADVSARTRSFPVTVQNPPEDYYSMAVDRVRYAGEPVAAVVADDKYRARDALEYIDVSYDRLDPVIDPEAATEDDAPQLHEGGNVANHRELAFGDVDGVFEDADHVVSDRFEFPRFQTTPLETYGVIADHGLDDNFDIWANYQGPFSMNIVMSYALGLPENKLQIKVPADQGGSFGVKIAIYPYMVLCAVASEVAEVPVKWIESRTEHLQASSHHASRVQYIEGAVDDDGTIRGVRFTQYDDYGAYIRPPEPGATFRSMGNWQGAYDIDAIGADLYAVQTNKCPTGPNRGYSCQEHYFALEGLVDRMADVVGMDPADLRRRNLINDDQLPFESLTGGYYDSGKFEQAIEAGLEAIDYERVSERRGDEDSYVGVGMATVIDPHVSNMGYMEVALPAEERERRGRPKSGVGEMLTLKMGPDASVTVDLTTVPGGNSHETTARQIVADELSIDPSEITVSTGIDTGTDAWQIATGSYSSRFGSVGHKAVSEAAQDVRAQIEAVGAHLLDVDPTDATLVDGEVVSGTGDSVSLRRIAGTTYWNPTELPEHIEPKLATLKAVNLDTATAVTSEDKINTSSTYAFAGHFVVVEVDATTGATEILDYVTVHDSGRLVNPMVVRGQIEGGTFMGFANAMYESHEYDSVGNLQTDTLMDYKMPTAKEAPQYRQKHFETPSPLTGMGSKGVGEAGTMTAIPALANAVRDALSDTDAETNVLPLNQRRVWEELYAGE